MPPVQPARPAQPAPQTTPPPYQATPGTPAMPPGPVGDWLQNVDPLIGQTVLTDESPRVCLGREQAITGSLQITLNWSRVPVDPRSRAAGLQRSTDIHLGCLWATTEGARGVVQAYRGGPDAAIGVGGTLLRLGPRSETEGQTLTVALRQAPHLQRLLLFAYADNGHPEWEPLGLTCTATLRGGIAVQWGLHPAPPGATVCALGSLHRVGGTLVLRRESRYVTGQQQAVAEAFGFDLVWLEGRSVVQGRLR